MYVFLGIIGELATIVGSSIMLVNAATDSILEISKNGYKIDKKVLNDIQNKKALEKQNNNSGIKRLLGTILLLTPGVNLINAHIKGERLKKEMINALTNSGEYRDAFVPMTDKEKEQYAKMKGKMQKLVFATTTIVESDKELLGFTEKRAVVVDNGLIDLYYDELLPLECTLDEVKRLNTATTYSYRIGKTDGRNIAIIGIPNPDRLVSSIRFRKENLELTHTFEKINEEDAKEETFTVYQPTIHPGTEENVERVIDKIKQSRINKSIKPNIEESQAQSSFEYYPNMIETEVQQGKAKIKSLNLRK